MDYAPATPKQQQLLTDILQFIGTAKGLKGVAFEDKKVRIHQLADQKFIEIEVLNLDEVLYRADVEGEKFLQVNFRSGSKILLTDSLIGFKPTAPKGLDTSKLPRVVTTPDVLNVFEAIQDSLHTAGPESHELAVLKKVYEAVLAGGEAIGFDLSKERSWVVRIPSAATKISS